MFNFSAETILSACNNLINCPAQVGGIISILSLLDTNITPLTTYSLNNQKLKLKLSNVFDKIPKTDFAEAEPKFIVFSKNWEKHFFDSIVKEKIDLISIAIFFLRRKSFSAKLSQEEIINLFIEENNISLEIQNIWFAKKYDISISYNDNDVEKNQIEFYKQRFKSIDFKSITFNSAIQKCAYEFSAAAHIQTLYSGNDIKKSFLYADVCLSEFYDFKNENTNSNKDGYIGVTAHEWWNFLKDKKLDKINFWSKKNNFNCLEKGDYFFFLKKNSKEETGERKVVGYAEFVEFKKQTVENAWLEFGEGNGYSNKEDFIKSSGDVLGDSNLKELGCIVLQNYKSFNTPVLLSDLEISFDNAIVSGKNITPEECIKMLRNQKNIDIPFTHNRIIFGAPGTGKSHKLEEQQQKYFGDNFERVTFHPNYSYAQFVGTYKPVMKNNASQNGMTEEVKKVIEILTDKTKTAQEKYDILDSQKMKKIDLIALIGLATGESVHTTEIDGTPHVKDHTGALRTGTVLRPYAELKNIHNNTSEITYSYIPGPFMRIYVNAVKELKRAKAKQEEPKNFLLLIEEINRANVAAVFGDVFQLLDRKSDGTSQYPIAASEDQKNYLESCGINEDEISIPSNMYIWATMNSADQGVQPMDAAFKRRWDFEYIGIDDNEESVKDYVLPIPQKNSDGNIFYTSENWNKIRKDINNKLKNIYGVNEDKLLGPYFLSKSTLDEAKQINFESETDKAEKICSLFKSKVLMYLYEDVVKMNPTELFSKSEFSEDKPLHYSDLCNKFDEVGLKIFGEEFVK